jgi:biopolymer transport protein ExbB/TolQ
MKEFVSEKLFQNATISFWTYTKWVLFLLAIFIIIRELVTWYYKINKIVSLLESINEKLSMQQQPQKINDENVKAISNVEKVVDNGSKEELSFIEEAKQVLNYDVKKLFSTKKNEDK